ncbi:MAG: alpha-L-fucosidase, partial [Cyclobacteriaceae bacterium]
YSLLLLGTLILFATCGPEKEKTMSEASLSEEPKFEPNWESLGKYEIPQWFNDAKFGIFIHWGPYTVPAFGSEWYPRLMYMDTATFTAQLDLGNEGPNPVYLHHKETWGDQKTFGYKDFIPMFKSEKFNADEWISLFKKAGARYVVPVAEHHDGFAMYNSQVTKWNSVNMGPKRDVLKELFDAGHQAGLKMGASTHYAFNWAFYNKKPQFDTMDPEYADLYSAKGPALDEPVSDEFKTLWWNRVTDIIDNYQPDILWFDFFWDQNAFDDYHPKVAAHYYNRGIEWNKEVVLQNKNFRRESFPEGTFVHDLERGKMSDTRKLPWQTDTSIGKNSWSHVTNWISKDANTLVDDLVDIVSKNGCMLLNVGPKADGTIPEDQKEILLQIGNWLDINGEAIYDTKYWKTFGEGPTVVSEGYMSEKKGDKGFTAEDIRFTTKNDKLYAILLDWPSAGSSMIGSLNSNEGSVKEVRMLGSETTLDWSQDENGLRVEMPAEKPCEYAYVLEISR